MTHEAILSNLIVLSALFLSLFIKRYIKEELKVIKPFCKLFNIVILMVLIVASLLRLDSVYLILIVILGFVMQNFIKTGFFPIPLAIMISSFNLNYLFSFSSLLSLYYLLFGYSNEITKRDLSIAVMLHLVLLALLLGSFLINYNKILFAFVIGLFINLVIKDIRELRKEKWHSI